MSIAIEREYPAVRKLPEPVPAEFFFVRATKIRFDGPYLEEFVEMISRDCPVAFDRRFDRLTASSELKGSGFHFS